MYPKGETPQYPIQHFYLQSVPHLSTFPFYHPPKLHLVRTSLSLQYPKLSLAPIPEICPYTLTCLIYPIQTNANNLFQQPHIYLLTCSQCDAFYVRLEIVCPLEWSQILPYKSQQITPSKNRFWEKSMVWKMPWRIL